MKCLILIILFAFSTPYIAQQVSDYFPPPNVGDYWIYEADSLMGESNSYTTIENYEALDLINEEEYFRYKVVSTYDSDGSVFVSFYSWTDDNRNLIAIGESSNVDSANILDPPIEMFPDISIGETWYLDISGSGRITSYYLDSFSESIEVPTGNYENCMKFIVSVEDDSGNTLANEEYFYAQDVGKILMVSDFTGRSELTEYSVGTVTSYDTLYVGPGETYTHINNALDAANEGDLIIVKDGSYAGDIMVDKSVVIQSENGSDNVFIDGVLTFTVDNISVSGFTFSELLASGIVILNNSSGHIVERNFFHARKYSIDIHDESSLSSNITIMGNTIEADSGDGISLNGNYHTIEENIITNCRGAGISIAGTKTEGVSIFHNYIADNGTNAINTAGSVNIYDNMMEGNNFAQIFIGSYEGDPVLIKYNHINNGNGIAIASRGPVEIIENEIKGNGHDGILITQHETALGIITGNDIIDNAGSGVQLRGYGEVENNLISGSGGYGVDIREELPNSVIVLDNEIRNSSWSGIQIKNNAVIYNNIVEKNEGEGIWISPHPEEVTLNNNRVFDNSGAGVGIMMDAKLRGNTIENNTYEGILIIEALPDLGQDSVEEAGNNIIRNNGGHSLVNENSNEVSAYRNYWGTTDSTEIDNLILDNDEADTLGAVNFMPCLLEEPATPLEEELTTNLIPKTTKLLPAYPNPFNPSTTILFFLAKTDEVTVKVYNNLGEEILTLVDGYINAGQYSVQFNASNLTSGVYYYRLTAGQFIDTRKLLLLK